MRIDRDNLISIGISTIVIPFYVVWVFLKWIGSQIIDLISLTFKSFKLQTAKLVGGAILLGVVSWLLNI